jgi:hypothetical protein
MQAKTDTLTVPSRGSIGFHLQLGPDLLSFPYTIITHSVLGPRI